MSDLEFFLPAILRVKHAEWMEESLDGVWPLVARKTGEGEVEILGYCMIISNQRYTPLHLRLKIGPANDEVLWLECTLGERGPHGMETTSARFLTQLKERLYALDGKVDLINWVYKVGFDHRRPNEG